MQPRRRRTGRIVVLFLVAVVVVLVAGGALLPRLSFPQADGTLTLPGLQGPVEVYRDAMGAPSIYASSEHDLFMAQGFVHAQDRFWQMDFWRHIGSGRLAEMFGDSQFETDAFIRTMGWPKLAEAEYEQADPELRAILEAYAAGVNAYLAQHKGASLSLEYAILGLLNPAYQPEPWTPVHSLTWAKAMAYDLGGNAEGELRRAALLAKIPPERVAELFPTYPSDHPVIVEGFGGSATASGAPAEVVAAAGNRLALTADRFAHLDALTGGGRRGLGSNNWVIGPDRTTTGSPLLANDMHLAIRMPSIWYENALHCQPAGPECRLQVEGFSFPGLPAVIVGHNDRIAWGVTNVGPDVQDLFLERVNPDNPDQYEVDGQWVDMDVRQEVIEVSGGETQTITVRETRHGPVLSDAWESGGAFAEQSSLEAGGPIAVSYRWTALEPSHILSAAVGLNLAQNWDEFRTALQDWDVPSQNFVYADVDGNIGYQMPGKIPIRAAGDGLLPIPGWDSHHDWTGYVPFDELPYAYNPAAGFIATANNAVAGPDYPYLISLGFDLGYRADRIVSMIEATPKLGPQDVAAIHGDDLNPAAPALVPVLLGLDFAAQEAPDLKATVDLLDGWDGQNRLDSASAAVFNAIWRHVILRTFSDELPADWLPGDDTAVRLVSRLVGEPANAWWDDLQTGTIETRDDILISAVQDAVDELHQRLGADPSKWTWGALHTATFENETLGQSGIGPIEALFNRGPFPTAGGSSIVNATGWDAAEGYAVDWAPSERVIMDLADWDRSQWIHTTGQSGHAFHPHYIDMADAWRTIQYAPMLWTRTAVETAAASHLTLTP